MMKKMLKTKNIRLLIVSGYMHTQRCAFHQWAFVRFYLVVWAFVLWAIVLWAIVLWAIVRCAFVQVSICPHTANCNPRLRNFDFFRTCRTISFCTVAWQSVRFHLTRRIARSLGDSWASCKPGVKEWMCDGWSGVWMEAELERLVRGWRREAGNWSHWRGEAYWKEQSLTRREDDLAGRACDQRWWASAARRLNCNDVMLCRYVGWLVVGRWEQLVFNALTYL